jgi:tripartite-type tricarboxylate transporter receptor subunit TctC
MTLPAMQAVWRRPVENANRNDWCKYLFLWMFYGGRHGMENPRQRLPFCVLAVICACAAGSAAAQTADASRFPTKPIRMIVYSSPGGSNDIFARFIAQRLTERLAQRVIVDNRPGADGIIGIQLTARAPADGYTLLMSSISYTVLPATHAQTYDPKSLMPVAQIALGGNVIATHPVFPAKSVKALVALAKARRGEIRYGAAGGFILLSAELFNSMAGIKLERIPYQGGAPSLIAVMSGEVEVTFGSLIQALPHVRSNKLKVLGVGTPQRSPLLPQVPAISETLRGYDGSIWWGVLAPAGVPTPIIGRLNSEINTILGEPEMAKRLAAEAAEPVIATPEAFGKLIATDLAKWARVAKEAGIRAE